jgi:hypothetical protein
MQGYANEKYYKKINVFFYFNLYKIKNKSQMNHTYLSKI